MSFASRSVLDLCCGGVFGWWNMYGSSTTYLHQLVVKVRSHVVNTSFVERFQNTCSFIHGVKRNSLNEDRVESLVYVHYNLRLLSHYFDSVKNDNSKRDMTWDNNPEETNLEDGAMVLERLEAKLLGDHILGVDMPPPSTSRVPDASVLPLSSQHPLTRGGHSVVGHVPRTLPPTPLL
jgi:hypothetical protein